MNNKLVRLVLFPFVAACGIALGQATTPAVTQAAPVRVLFIGSSLSDGLAAAFASVVLEADPSLAVETHEATLASVGLRTHWQGRTSDRVRESRWDYVVLQQGFDVIPNDTYFKLFDEAIRKSGGKAVVFVTWPYRGNSRRQKELDDAFLKITRELKLIAAPVGPAWQIAENRTPGIPLYRSDDLHAAPMGTYTAACTIYSAIFGKPVPVEGATGPTATARAAAWEAVQKWRGMLGSAE